MTLIFDKLAHLNICCKRCCESLFSQFQRKKTVSKELKTWYFSDSAFWLKGQWGGGAIAPPAPPGYATGQPSHRSDGPCSRTRWHKQTGNYKLGRVSEVLPQIRKGKTLVRRARITVSNLKDNGQAEITNVERDLSKLAPLEMGD